MAKRPLTRNPSLPRPLQDSVILCDNRHASNINLSRESLTIRCNLSPEYGLSLSMSELWKYRPEGRLNQLNSSEYNPILPFSYFIIGAFIHILNNWFRYTCCQSFMWGLLHDFRHLKFEHDAKHGALWNMYTIVLLCFILVTPKFLMFSCNAFPRRHNWLVWHGCSIQLSPIKYCFCCIQYMCDTQMI